MMSSCRQVTSNGMKVEVEQREESEKRIRTGVDDQKVLLLMRINMADTGEEKTGDRVFIANGGHKRALLLK